MLQKLGTWEQPTMVERTVRRPPTPQEYINLTRRYRDEIGGLEWIAPQDSMCEPAVIYGGQYGVENFVGTRQFIDPNGRLSFDELVWEHQIRTIDNLVELRDLGPDLNIEAAVQGWTEDQYVRCVELYWTRAGIDLTKEPLVLVGSMCRRQNTAEAGRILQRLDRMGLKHKHGLGFKLEGLEQHGDLLARGSADSQAWCRGARWGDYQDMRLPGCNHKGPKHTNCLAYALWWRERKVLPAIAECGRRGPRAEQLSFFDLDNAA